jgi:hypothetical protein
MDQIAIPGADEIEMLAFKLVAAARPPMRYSGRSAMPTSE